VVGVRVASAAVMGTRVVRREDPRFVRGAGTYVPDLLGEVSGAQSAAHAAFVRSPVAHARISEIGLDRASVAPGVLAVVDAERLGLASFLAEELAMMVDARMRRPWLATGTVRFVGEPVVCVIAATRAQALDAAELVEVAYEPLPVVVDPFAAESGDAPLLFPEALSNRACESGVPTTGAAMFEGCDVVVRQRIVNRRVAPAPLETRSAIARWDDAAGGDDSSGGSVGAGPVRLTLYTGNQRPHAVRDLLAAIFGLAPSGVRVVVPDVGGGFGAKIYPAFEEVVVAAMARRLGQAVSWVETRSESMTALGHGRAQVHDVEMGGTADGRIEAYRLTILQEAGAYPDVGAMLPGYTQLMTPGCYMIPAIETWARSVVTNTAPTVAYRGAGRPEAAAAIERTVDLFAGACGLDPADVRRRNAIAAAAFPHTTPTGAVYDSGDYHAALDWALRAVDLPGVRAEQARRRSAGDALVLGVGIALYVEVTNPIGESEHAAVEVTASGRVVVRTGTAPTGQGHATAWAMLAGDRLGVSIDDIEVVHGDTDAVTSGMGTMGSRSLQVGGLAVDTVAGEVLDEARRRVAVLIEANVDDVVLRPGAAVDAAGIPAGDGHVRAARLHVVGTPEAGFTWAQLVELTGPLAIERDVTGGGPTFPYGVHVAVVEVDTETGAVRLLRFVAVDDAGVILNPTLAEGQLHGGIAQGVAQALWEEVVYDDAGNPLTANLADYAIPSAAELPSFELHSIETPSPRNALGAKGIGESGSIGATPAVQNAVCDALAHLGVVHVDMPCTPQRVWNAIRSAQGPS
jgi:aerobic carbon-monoxide dehydrogenase large subunit